MGCFWLTWSGDLKIDAQLFKKKRVLKEVKCTDKVKKEEEEDQQILKKRKRTIIIERQTTQ